MLHSQPAKVTQQPSSPVTALSSIDADSNIKDCETGRVIQETEAEETSKAVNCVRLRRKKSEEEHDRKDENIVDMDAGHLHEKNGDVVDKEVAELSRNTNSTSDKQNADSRKRTAETAHLDNGHESEASLCSKKRSLLTKSDGDEEGIHVRENSGLTAEQLIEHVQSMKKRGLLAEYHRIRAEPPVGTFTHSRARHNLHKNRYTDVLCYDHSRVTLAPTAGTSKSDYINANLVDGYRCKNAYISTQGPLPKTSGDFWRMVWQHHCQVIVMTTRTVERQRTKCGQYWPCEELTEEQFGEFTVTNESVTSFNTYRETRLVLRNNSTSESREVRHLQFLSWPDFGVPPAAGFLEFLLRVRGVQQAAVDNLQPPWNGPVHGPPIVVHCSAGIGRTGTFITVDVCLRRLADTGRAHIPSTVRRVRSQRAGSIQMPDQYVFCYLAVIEHARRTGLVSETVSLLNSEDSD